ncbi:opacity protein-like surface antigen [Bradyrhizobium sp. USDA 3240]
MLLYVKGGAAVVRDKYRVFDFATGLTIDNGSETCWGGTVGARLEFGFAPNWSIGVEYDHLFMGHRDVDFFFHLDSWVVRRPLSRGLPVSVRTSISVWSA